MLSQSQRKINNAIHLYTCIIKPHRSRRIKSPPSPLTKKSSPSSTTKPHQHKKGHHHQHVFTESKHPQLHLHQPSLASPNLHQFQVQKDSDIFSIYLFNFNLNLISVIPRGLRVILYDFFLSTSIYCRIQSG